MSDDQKIRLSKLMADKGICSRREADAYIEQGLVLVNGERITTLGTKVDPSVSITLEARALKQQKQLVTIILNKPIGYVSAQPEPGYTPAIRLLTAQNQWSENSKDKKRFDNSHLEKLAVAGRLDIDSQGVLLFTQDGRIAKKIIGENSEIEKEYIVRVEGKLPAEKLKLLNHGLELDGQKLKPAQVEWINEDQLRFILREGKKRQIRRMCELVGLKVTGLKRVRIGKIRLGKLPEGMWRYLGPDETL
ncbi:MAG: pseudouridine synthase [Bdellovibrionia bacterium]